MLAVPQRTAVLVIGGGPAGSMAAAMLAREGVDVTVLERDKHPRYHIGESLLLSAIPLLDFVGVLEQVRAHGFVRKSGGIFKLKHDAPAGFLDFGRSRHGHAFQVIRSEFDQLLFEHARGSGAVAVDECRVTEVQFDAANRPVSAVWSRPDGQTGQIGFDHLIDASGLQGLLATRYLRNREIQPAFMNVALVQYHRATNRIEGARAGAIHVESLTDGSGWAWVIPLHDGSDSVGIVVHRDIYSRSKSTLGTPEAVFRDRLALAPDTLALVGAGHPVTEVKLWQDYSHAASCFAGPGYRLIGDAAGFIDPFFSSGVHLAFLGALAAAASVVSSIRGDLPEQAAAEYHEKLLRRAYLRMMLVVTAIYRQIHEQHAVVLPAIAQADFQRAFDILLPLVGGALDVDADEVPEQALTQVMTYLGEGLLEAHDMTGHGRVAKLMGRQMATFELSDISPEEAIDGLYIHMQRGELGLRRLGRWGRATASLRRKAIGLGLRGAALADHGKVS